MYDHPLVEVADMLYRVCSTIVHGESRMHEPLRKSPSLNLARERWPGNLVECFTHGVVSQAYRRWIFVSALMMIVLIIWERLTRGSPRSTPITAIILTIRREVRVGWSSLSQFMVQASIKVINLLLHVFGVLFMRDVAFTPWLTFTSVGSMHTSLLVPFLFKIAEVILILRPHRLCLVWTWTYYRPVLDSL